MPPLGVNDTKQGTTRSIVALAVSISTEHVSADNTKHVSSLCQRQHVATLRLYDPSVGAVIDHKELTSASASVIPALLTGITTTRQQ